MTKTILVLITALAVYTGIFLLIKNNQSTIGNYVHHLYGEYVAPIEFESSQSDLFESAQIMSRQLEQSEKKNSFLQAQVDYYQNPTTLSRPKPRVMIVAGHTAQSPGAVFGGVTEYEVNYSLSQQLVETINEEDFEVITTHEGEGYSALFAAYIKNNEASITRYKDAVKKAYKQKYPQGVVTNDTNHNVAPPKTVLQLYGVNKWAIDNNIDLIIHIHFNDYVRNKSVQPGEHTGFALFVPLKTNTNFAESYSFAKILEDSLLRHFSRSTLKVESAGVLESELIAVGHFDALEDIPSVLIEGGYIYEQHIQDPRMREQALVEYSQDIHQALRTYFKMD